MQQLCFLLIYHWSPQINRLNFFVYLVPACCWSGRSIKKFPQCIFEIVTNDNHVWAQMYGRYNLLKFHSGQAQLPLSLSPGSCPFHPMVHLCSMSKALLNFSNSSLAQPGSVQTKKSLRSVSVQRQRRRGDEEQLAAGSRKSAAEPGGVMHLHDLKKEKSSFHLYTVCFFLFKAKFSWTKNQIEIRLCVNGFERKRVEDDEAPNVDVIAERFIFMARGVTLISLHEITL